MWVPRHSAGGAEALGLKWCEAMLRRCQHETGCVRDETSAARGSVRAGARRGGGGAFEVEALSLAARAGARDGAGVGASARAGVGVKVRATRRVGVASLPELEIVVTKPQLDSMKKATVSVQHYESNGCDRLRNIGGRNNGILNIGLSRSTPTALLAPARGEKGRSRPRRA